MKFYGRPEGPVSVMYRGSCPHISFQYMANDIEYKYFINPTEKSLLTDLAPYTVRINGEDVQNLEKVLTPEAIIKIEPYKDASHNHHIIIKITNNRLESQMIVEKEKVNYTYFKK